LIFYFTGATPHELGNCGNQDETDQTERQKKVEKLPVEIGPEKIDSHSERNKPAGKNNNDIPTENLSEIPAGSSFEEAGGYLRVTARASGGAEMVAPGANTLPEQNYGQAAVRQKEKCPERTGFPKYRRAQNKQNGSGSVVQHDQPCRNDTFTVIGNIAVGTTVLLG
jgi:hypothetical protein